MYFSLKGSFLGIVAVSLFGIAVFLFANIGKSEPERTAAFLERVRSGLPIRLRIPKIQVDASLEHVGLSPDGSIGVPEGPANAAWFSLGPRPGEKGNSVIDGHYGWKDGIPAVFDGLSKLRKGDKLYVEDEKGKTTVFVVKEIRTFGENESTENVFTSSDEESHLNLITCGGIWNKKKHSYSDRLVVFSDQSI